MKASDDSKNINAHMLKLVAAAPVKAAAISSPLATVSPYARPPAARAPPLAVSLRATPLPPVGAAADCLCGVPADCLCGVPTGL